MEKYLLVTLIIIGILIVGLLLVLILRNKNNNNFEMSNLNQKIDKLEKDLPYDISNKFDDKINRLSKSINLDFNNQIESDNKRLIDFQQKINESLDIKIGLINKRIDENLNGINDRVNKSMTDGFKTTLETVEKLKKDLGILQEAQKNLEGLNNNVLGLSNILSNNQTRGKYGEWSLELMLKNTFGEQKGITYDFQYEIEKGLRVDSIIFLNSNKTNMVPIDSKFSLVGYDKLIDNKLNENDYKQALSAFKLALRQRIDETKKYIVLGKTINNALMYIPSDSIFSYIEINMADTVEYARKNNVILVSPTILIPLIASFKIMQLDEKKSENIREVNKALNALADEFKRFAERWTRFSNSIDTLQKNKNEFNTTVEKIDKKFGNISSIDFESDKLE